MEVKGFGERAARISQCSAKAYFSQGLISRTTYSEAINLVYSVMDFSELLRYPVCLTKEARAHECTQDTQ